VCGAASSIDHLGQVLLPLERRGGPQRSRRSNKAWTSRLSNRVCSGTVIDALASPTHTFCTHEEAFGLDLDERVGRVPDQVTAPGIWGFGSAHPRNRRFRCGEDENTSRGVCSVSQTMVAQSRPVRDGNAID